MDCPRRLNKAFIVILTHNLMQPALRYLGRGKAVDNQDQGDPWTAFCWHGVGVIDQCL